LSRVDLSDELRDRRKAAGRTIASVAVDAGLSVPYIANLENGRGNPTLSALARLATALGAHLQVTLEDDPPPFAATTGTSVGTPGGVPTGTSAAAPAGSSSSAAARGTPGTSSAASRGTSGGTIGGVSSGTSGGASAELLAASPRATKVIATLASSQGRTRRSVERQLLTTLDALNPLLPSPPTDTDLNRLLDLLLLAD
jgi:DNA-binding XRE family transcriptional regulator